MQLETSVGRKPVENKVPEEQVEKEQASYSFDVIESALLDVDPTDTVDYNAIWAKKINSSPDIKLLRGILKDAIHTIKEYKSSNNSIYRETKNWFLDIENIDYVFSFPSVCSSLNLSPTYILRQLKKYL